MLEEIILPRQDVLDARPSRLDNQRRCDSAARRHAAEVECFLDVVGVAVPCAKAGGLMGRISQKKSHLLCVQPRGAAGGRCPAEKWRGAGSAPVALRFKLLPTQRSEEHTSELQYRLHLVCR